MRGLFLTALILTLSTMNASAQSLGSLTGAATDALTGAATSAALDSMTVDSFDPALLNQLIDQAPVSDATKGTLKEAVQAAVDNPELVQAAIDQVKAALL